MAEAAPRSGEALMVLGTQWGDEGKGKLVDMLAGKCDVVARCQGGNNAGHTIKKQGTTYDFHLLPSGIIHSETVSVIGNGVVVNVPALFQEATLNEKKGLRDWQKRLLVSDRAHLVFDFHQSVDGIEEVAKGGSSIGTTQKGIGPTYSSKASRVGLRVGDLVGNFDIFATKFSSLVATYRRQYPGLVVDVEAQLAMYKGLAEQLRPMVCDTVFYLHRRLQEGARVLVEGANAHMLDIDFGTYPYVTSSSCSVGGACTGLGIRPTAIGQVLGVVKAYTTRVGGGPFPTEQLNDVGEKLQSIGAEVGVTTGRKRRCGWLDLVVVNFTHVVNGLTGIMITKLDVLDTFEEIKVAVKYHHKGQPLDCYPGTLDKLAEIEVEYKTFSGWLADTTKCRTWQELPEKAKDYIRFIEKYLGVPVYWVGVGSSTDATLTVPRPS